MDTHVNGTALQVASQKSALAPLQFSDEQRQIIRDTLANGASEQEFAVLMEMAKSRHLNPLLSQIWFVQRWDSQKNRMVWACQVSIDGLRAQAERTGLYAGQDEPEYEYEKDGTVKLARVKVYRKDWERPAVGVARWSEYAARKKDGSLTGMWSSKPHIMIGKCAEALALRKAFPAEAAGLYTSEEMDAPSAVHVDAEQAPLESQLQKSVDVIGEYQARIASTQAVADLEAIGAELRKQPASVRAALKAAYKERRDYLADAPPPSAERQLGEDD